MSTIAITSSPGGVAAPSARRAAWLGLLVVLPAGFLGATNQALLVAVAFLVLAAAAVCWLPKHARSH
jgi:hypothetical protein